MNQFSKRMFLILLTALAFINDKSSATTVAQATTAIDALIDRVTKVAAAATKAEGAIAKLNTNAKIFADETKTGENDQINEGARTALWYTASMLHKDEAAKAKADSGSYNSIKP